MKALIEKIVAETDHPSNPYLVALAEDRFDRVDFIETQIAFFYAVVFFNRPMAACAAKIPSTRLRREILRNVWEEHGEGQDEDAHGATFLEFLSRLGGVSQLAVMGRTLWPEVRMFNTTLTGACIMDEYLIGVSVLGIIERMFADISARIGKSVVENGWMTEERLVHYKLHAEIDIKHADDFFAVLQPAWEKDDSDRYYIEQGLRMGAHSFDQLYRGLWNARKRRWMREHLVPNVRT
jgi:pyrroloquinoline-quinone synthase